MARIADGDRTAFRALYAATAPRLMAVARALMRDRTRAEDILQEAFVRTWQNAPKFDGTKGSALAWLTTITRRLAIDELRKGKVPQQSIDDDAILMNTLAADLNEPDPMGTGRLKPCLEQLRDEYRQAVLLSHIYGYTYEELSLRFDRPLGTVKTWVHRGLSDLRMCIG